MKEKTVSETEIKENVVLDPVQELQDFLEKTKIRLNVTPNITVGDDGRLILKNVIQVTRG